MIADSALRVLLLGDLHLSTTGPDVPPACPSLESIDVDAVVSIGDVIDDNRDHASDTSAGEAYERRGREFFRRLDTIGVPVFAVPGNHDPVETTHRLTDGLDDITVLHRRAVDGGEVDEALTGVRFAGWGCEQFDLTPAFRYDRYPGVVPESVEYDSVDRQVTEIASTVEAAVGGFLAGRLTAAEAAANIGVSPDARRECTDDLEELAASFERVQELLTPSTGPTVLLSHESPFNVAFDYHHSGDGLESRLHRGSIPLKMAIIDRAPDVVFSGHMHSRGHDAIETPDGHTQVYNPGSPGAVIAEIDPETGSVQIVV